MTPADIITEYRQISALEEEKKSGKQQSEEVVNDSEYEEWQRSLGVQNA